MTRPKATYLKIINTDYKNVRVVPTGDTYKIDLSGRHQQANHKNVLTVLDDVNVENDDTMTG